MSKELEALEKKFPDDGNGDDDAYNKGWNDCRERVLTLLTTRQEVAPVDAVITGLAALTAGQAAIIAGLAEINGKLPEPTGQTSDARDAARYRWLRNRAINFGLDDERGTPYCVYGIGAGDATPTDGEELDNMIDHCAEIDAAKEQAQ